MRSFLALVFGFFSMVSFSSFASAEASGSGFSPKSTLVCRDASSGESVRISFRTVVSRAGGYIWHRQTAIMDGMGFESFAMTIPSKGDVISICGMEKAGKVCFEYRAARNWRKEGYDYDTGEFSAKIFFTTSGTYGAYWKTLDHCR